MADAVSQLSAGPAGFTTSRNGAIAYNAASVFGSDIDLTWVTRDGKADKPLVTLNGIHTIALDRDGRMLALEHSVGAVTAVWLMDLYRGTRTRLTSGEPTQGHPVWSPDGSQVAFFDGRPGTHTRLMIKPAAGTGGAAPVSSAVNDPVSSRQMTDWSRDGRLLLYEEGGAPAGFDLKYVDLTGEREPQTVIQGAASERNGQLSPDGRFIAYESNESGRNEIYVSPFPKAVMRWAISSRGGEKARWLAGGRELVFVDAEGVLQSVSIDASSGAVRAGIPKALFPLDAADTDGFNYAPSADGSRFIVMRPSATGREQRVSVILNWPATIR